MEEIREFIAKLKKKKIEYNYLKVYMTSANDFDLLKLESDKILKKIYINFICDSENKNEIIDEDELFQICENFGINSEHNLFKKYDIFKLISENGDLNCNSTSISAIKFGKKIKDSLFKAYMIGEHIRNTENLIRCGNISLKNIKDSIVFYYLGINSKTRYNINNLKRLINNDIFVLFQKSSKANLKDFRLNYKLSIILDDKYEINFTGGQFLTNWNLISYKEFTQLMTEFDVNQSEFWHILLHFNNLYSKNKVQIKNNINTLINKKKSEEVTKNFEITNPFQKDIEIILQNNYGNKIIKIIQFNNEILESKFNDFQAFHICKGLKNQRKLYTRYINKKHSESDIFQAHKLANTLLKSKGKKIIDFLLSLPPLPFNSDNFKILFSALDRIKNNGLIDNPMIRLKIKNEENINEDIEISFLSIDRVQYINQISIKNISKKINICKISRNGKVIPEENTHEKLKNKNITPVLQLFYRITKTEKEFNNAIFSYGIESGKCSICGRKLEDEKSLIKGIGPICEKYFA
ncbi:hypothetical protein JSO62_10380 [Riemerella anatipestifer]|uniref:DUF6011 domain-containing protein n=1 Tax=Riemerella anatipestifer TaxID=34085 RepID=UPI0030BE95B4